MSTMESRIRIWIGIKMILIHNTALLNELRRLLKFCGCWRLDKLDTK
jgi:hypothetical protein